MSDELRAFVEAARALLDIISDTIDDLPDEASDAYEAACIADMKLRREVPAA